MKLIAIALALLVAACTPISQSNVGPDPADPSVRVPSARYESALGGYLSRRPVEPRPWREQNERVTPRPER